MGPISSLHTTVHPWRLYRFSTPVDSIIPHNHRSVSIKQLPTLKDHCHRVHLEQAMMGVQKWAPHLFEIRPT